MRTQPLALLSRTDQDIARHANFRIYQKHTRQDWQRSSFNPWGDRCRHQRAGRNLAATAAGYQNLGATERRFGTWREPRSMRHARGP